MYGWSMRLSSVLTQCADGLPVGQQREAIRTRRRPPGGGATGDLSTVSLLLAVHPPERHRRGRSDSGRRQARGAPSIHCVHLLAGDPGSAPKGARRAESRGAEAVPQWCVGLSNRSGAEIGKVPTLVTLDSQLI